MNWSPAVFTAVLLSPFVASFLGVVVRRVPAGRPVVVARSSCDSCGSVISGRHLVPVVSFLWLRGRCGHCRARIDSFHLAVEIAGAGLAISAVLVERDPARIWADLVVGGLLLAIAATDRRHTRFRSLFTALLAITGLIATAVLGSGSFVEHAGLATFCWFAAPALRTCPPSARLAISAEDIFLAGAGAAWLGWRSLIALILYLFLDGLRRRVIGASKWQIPTWALQSVLPVLLWLACLGSAAFGA